MCVTGWEELFLEVGGMGLDGIDGVNGVFVNYCQWYFLAMVPVLPFVLSFFLFLIKKIRQDG